MPVASCGPSRSNVSEPFSLRWKYSACSLKLRSTGLPSGAHFQTKSSPHISVSPVNASVTGAPNWSRSSIGAFVGFRSCDSRAEEIAVAEPNVATEVREHHHRVEAVLVAIGARELVAETEFHAELDQQRGRCDPARLQAVLLQLAAEERLQRERRVDEVPRVRVNFVEIAEVGQKPSELDRALRESEPTWLTNASSTEVPLSPSNAPTK